MVVERPALAIELGEPLLEARGVLPEQRAMQLVPTSAHARRDLALGRVEVADVAALAQRTS